MNYQDAKDTIKNRETKGGTIMNIHDFIKKHKITMTIARTDNNPNMDDARNMDHWKCILKRPGARLTIYFSMGYGHNGRMPELADVLDCLVSDASSVRNSRGFEDWCADLGYDTDSRKAEKTYKTCERQADKLERF